MKSIVKEFIKESFYLVLWFYRWLRSILYGHFNISKLDKNFNKKIIIAGNGPSTCSFDFLDTKYKEYEFLCVNMFASNYVNFFQLKPKYYCLVDDQFYKGGHTEDAETKIQILKDTLEKVDWELYLVSVVHQKIFFNNKNIKHVYINNNVYEGAFFRNELFKRNIAWAGAQTVINAAVYYAITSEFKEVYLIGVETDGHLRMSINDENELIEQYTHFYGVEERNMTKEGYGKGTLYYQFYSLYSALKKYSIYEEYATHMNVKIYNITPGSFIDVFERKII